MCASCYHRLLPTPPQSTKNRSCHLPEAIFIVDAFLSLTLYSGAVRSPGEGIPALPQSTARPEASPHRVGSPGVAENQGTCCGAGLSACTRGGRPLRLVWGAASHPGYPLFVPSTILGEMEDREENRVQSKVKPRPPDPLPGLPCPAHPMPAGGRQDRLRRVGALEFLKKYLF